VQIGRSGICSSSAFEPRIRRGLPLALALAAMIAAGAAGTREATVHNIARDAADRVVSGLDLSACTSELLSRHGLRRAALLNPLDAALRLEAACESRPAEPGAPLALAELWYRSALRPSHRDPATTVYPLRAAAAAAALALSGSGGGCCDRAVEVHNAAVARLVRISQDERVSGACHWTLGLARRGVVTAGASPFVDPGRFAGIQAAEDLHVSGMQHEFSRCGLGVPVVGDRHVDRDRPSDADERFFPPRLRVAATALASSGGGLAGGAYRSAPLTLTFHDPFQVAAVRVGERSLPLAADRTTHLAAQASQGVIQSQIASGLFGGDFGQQVKPGLYMLRPYEPGKIPVVFVHGLASSPLAYVQAINEFQNDPTLSSRYQFWVFAYPTGRAIIGSAARLREALGQAEEAYGADPAFGRMVVVGHSMGGVISHMLASDSGREVWDSALNAPPESLRASPETRATLDRLLFFEPVPYVSRLIFIATPHRGSRLANGLVGRVVGRRITPPADQAAILAELKALNGPEILKDQNFVGASISSIGNLRVDSPMLLAVSRLPVAPGVPYHTIAYRFAGHASSDLVVPLWSAHLDGAASETILPGNHSSEQEPSTLAEVRRILLEHLSAP